MNKKQPIEKGKAEQDRDRYKAQPIEGYKPLFKDLLKRFPPKKYD